MRLGPRPHFRVRETELSRICSRNFREKSGRSTSLSFESGPKAVKSRQRVETLEDFRQEFSRIAGRHFWKWAKGRKFASERRNSRGFPPAIFGPHAGRFRAPISPLRFRLFGELLLFGIITILIPNKFTGRRILDRRSSFPPPAVAFARGGGDGWRHVCALPIARARVDDFHDHHEGSFQVRAEVGGLVSSTSA